MDGEPVAPDQELVQLWFNQMEEEYQGMRFEVANFAWYVVYPAYQHAINIATVKKEQEEEQANALALAVPQRRTKKISESKSSV